MVSSKNTGHEDNNPRKGLPGDVRVSTDKGGGNTRFRRLEEIDTLTGTFCTNVLKMVTAASELSWVGTAEETRYCA